MTPETSSRPATDPKDSLPERRRRTSAWSPVLFLVIAIPAGTVVAGILTLVIASQMPFQPGSVAIDRFGHPVAESR